MERRMLLRACILRGTFSIAAHECYRCSLVHIKVAPLKAIAAH